MNCVEISEVTKTYGDKAAVNRLSLEIPEGSIYGFIGPNGSGKSTTLRMIMSIIYPDSGEIQVLGKRAEKTHNRAIGYLPEERGLYQKMKVFELIQYFGELKVGKFPKADIDSWLDRFDLTAAANKKVEALSKGMSQKVQFISTVIGRPKLLILDEPFSGLDPVNMDVVRRAIIELRQEGTTVIFSTHDMSTAEQMCDRIFMIYQGNKVLDGSLKEIQDHYSLDTIRLRMSGPAIKPGQIEGIASVNNLGQEQHLRLQEGVLPQTILNKLIPLGDIHHFEAVTPSLHEIFIRIASPDPVDLEDAIEGVHHA